MGDAGDDVLDVELRKQVNQDGKEKNDKLRADGDEENLKRKRRRIKESINKTNKVKKVKERKATGMTGQDQHDLNKVSTTLKQSEEGQKNSKQFFKGINESKGKGKDKSEGYFKNRGK